MRGAAKWVRCAGYDIVAGHDVRRVTHIGVATDHVIESFRNNLWAGYKTR